VIGGIAVNHWAEEPMVTADVDLVVALERVEEAVSALEKEGFKAERFPWSVNLKGSSKVSVQISTEERYRQFPARAVAADVWGMLMRVASLEDTLAGKLAASETEGVRAVKRSELNGRATKRQGQKMSGGWLWADKTLFKALRDMVVLTHLKKEWLCGLLGIMAGFCQAQPIGDPNRHVIFVHGFNINEQEARAWSSEMFKRLCQSGNNAQFHTVDWKGDVGWPDPGLFYHQNVANAFAAAPNLANYVNNLQGRRVIVAHSLGNVVVSSAIADHGMVVDKYIMLNAAVPVEAYDDTVHNESVTGNPMLHTDWTEYQKETWASCWHEHFANLTPSDDRNKLGWKGRFANIPPSIMYNFYSAGDEVLKIYTGTGALQPMTGGGFRLYAWQKQEWFKGRSMMYGTTWSGWGFGHPTYTEHVYDPVAQAWVYLTHEYYPDAAAANAAAARQIMDIPVFGRYPEGMFTNAIPLQVRNEILAKGIPALSPPAGNCSIGRLDIEAGMGHNINLDTSVFKQNGWRNHPDYGTGWLHSDWVNLAFFYVYPLLPKS
jgi:hypothetical protein